MIKVVCDCCEREFKFKDDVKQQTICASKLGPGFPSTDLKWDLCPKCYRNILKDMKLVFNDRRKETKCLEKRN